MNNSKNKAFLGQLKSKKWVIIIAVGILMVGVFLRAYNFADWMHFELDQSRDAKVVGLAVQQGIGNLPLLGPKAAGSFLRLGPIFYYFGYLSAKIFGNTPSGIAVVTLVFSCLTLPLFYFFSRKFFSQKIALMLLSLFSVSIFLVLYSRFSWNPNNLPFFILAGLYGLLRATDVNEKRKGWWLVGGIFMLTVATQLHFVAFLGLPMIAVAYLLIKRPSISWKHWLASVAVIVFLYIPAIVNDFKTGGENIAEFEKVFAKTSTKGEHSIIEKIIRNVDKSSVGYVLLLSGNAQAELPKVKLPGLRPVFSCDNDCKEGVPIGLISLFFVIVGSVLLGWRIFTTKESSRRDFLIIIAIWLVVALILFTPIAYDLAPRFFLLVAPISFIFLGLILDFFEKMKLNYLAWILVALLLFSNGWFIKERFSELANASMKEFEIESDKILKENERVTVEQQLLITDYIETIYRQNNFPVYVNSEAFYRRSFLYHLEQRGVVRDDFRNTKNIYAEGNYFLIYPTSSTLEKISENYLEKYTINEVKKFGTLQVVRLIPKPQMISAVRQEFGPEKKPTSAFGVPVRCRLNEIFGKCNLDGTEADDENAIE